MAKRKTPTPDLSYIAEPLRPLAVAIDAVAQDPRNARRHDEANLKAIKKSLKRFGLRVPIVVNGSNGLILAGNARWQVAKDLGWSMIAVVYVTDDANTATGFALADNRTAELAAWDDTLLAELLADLKQSDSPDDADLVAALQLDALLATETVGQTTTTEIIAGERYQVVANCATQEQQQALYQQLKNEGYDCRASTIRHTK